MSGEAVPTTLPTTLVVETTTAEPCPHDFLGDSADIVYFISFAHSERYGADHPLAKAAAILKRKLRVNLAPLMNYADARTENAEEEAHLERLWQDAAPLAESASTAAEAIEANADLRDLTSDLPELPRRLRELAEIAAWAAGRDAQVRLTYII
jgi:alkylhydroperoxidase/carboxymuconolactone decarboxylase family protein YurZ